MTSQQPKLGVDVGGVILDFIPHMESELSFAGDNYLDTPEIEDAIDTIARLGKGRFGSDIFLISRYGEHGPGRIFEWLKHKNFFDRVDIPESHFHPCAERDAKAPIAKELGITHFVDDRAEVMSHMIGIVPNLYLFQSLKEDSEDFTDARKQMTYVESWAELEPLLLND